MPPCHVTARRPRACGRLAHAHPRRALKFKSEERLGWWFRHSRAV